jgi:hypothetical protein
MRLAQKEFEDYEEEHDRAHSCLDVPGRRGLIAHLRRCAYGKT